MGERSEMGKRLEGAMSESLEHARGERELRETAIDVPAVDVKSVRETTGMTQVDFARHFGFSLSAVRHWEQGRRRPEKPARILLKMIRDQRDVVEQTLDQLERTEDSDRAH